MVLTKDNAEARFAGFPIKKAGDMRQRGIFMTLYGQGGVGKTTLAAELYRLGKTIYADAEAGTDSVAHLGDEPNLDIVDITSWRDFEKFVNALPDAVDTLGYINIVVDNLCELLDRCEEHHGIVGNDAHDLQRYKLVTRDMMRKIRFLRELARTRGINVILIAWDMDTQDAGVVKKDIAFTPALRKEYPGICTIIAHVAPTNSPDVRQIDFATSRKTIAKFKRPADSTAQSVPWKINYTVDKLPLIDIINTIKGVTEWPSKKYGKASEE